VTNEQTKAARAVLNKYPALKVTIGKTQAGETLTPYLADDVFVRGADVLVTPATLPATIAAEFNAACHALMAENG
jgi:2-keto-3-deoxy-6-phosphogluconate aldolase